MTANDLPIITDLNIAPNGDGFFDSSSQHTPAPVDGNGVVITRRSDDTAWQMLVADTSPREFWKRTWHSDQSRWRTWKSFGDMHTINQTLAAALDNLEHNIDESRIDTRIAAQIDEHIENERAARDSEWLAWVSVNQRDLSASGQLSRQHSPNPPLTRRIHALAIRPVDQAPVAPITPFMPSKPISVTTATGLDHWRQLFLARCRNSHQLLPGNIPLGWSKPVFEIHQAETVYRCQRKLTAAENRPT
jgi:hypothetical protein